ncbi:MAG: hypothetical protein KC912_03715 [Proteobacteria bacterium]|nr:hypothetical protein [Pseudomonadota bacterium]
MSRFAFLTRRRFLALAGGTVAVGAGATGGVMLLRGSAPGVDGLRQLSAQGYRTIAAVARTHLPPGGAVPSGADDAGLARAFDGWLADEPPEVIRDLSMALHLVEFGPMLFDGQAATFSNLAPDAQLKHWEGWLYAENDTRRQVAVAFKKFLALVFFDRPEVWAAIGYGGPSFHGMPK